MRPTPTASSANSHARTHSDWAGTLPLTNRPEHRDGHRRHRHGADDRHDPVEHQRAQARAIEAAQIEQQHHQRRQRQQRSASAEACSAACTPPRASTTAAHSSTKSTVGRSTLQPGPSSAHCSGPPNVRAASDCGRGAARQLAVKRKRGRCLLGDGRAGHLSGGPCPYPVTRILGRIPLATRAFPPRSSACQSPGERAHESQRTECSKTM